MPSLIQTDQGLVLINYVSSVFIKVFFSSVCQNNFFVFVKISTFNVFFNTFKLLILKQVTCFEIFFCEFGFVDLLPNYRMQLERQGRGASDCKPDKNSEKDEQILFLAFEVEQQAIL